ncbi:HIT domain-containing protein [Terrilactibacillus sp. BCM23-1]|uniref:HIT domain-containing protein n=1 Tax=Terrilactibacillus tamarindi TaxID=2599694 RepID=A0A6N8CKY9_9BACI|nr:HIT family protein [Terrilactibacillus tamarindi]MTT30484.1 HIT domain-containing protein [Terrilactibacillus tamarindi]
MSHDENCVFCKIIKGEIPSAKVFENEDIYAFLDLSQVTKGHTLVIPKKHQQDIFQLDPETAAAIYKKVPMIANAIKDAFKPAGMNIINNNGSIASQTVFHYHVHLIPRYDETDGFTPVFQSHMDDYTEADRKSIAEQIKTHTVK